MITEPAKSQCQAERNELAPEKVEEQKLLSKFPQTTKSPLGSQLLLKRLQQRKFFDSGDYNMAKAKSGKMGVFAAPSNQPSQYDGDVEKMGHNVDEIDDDADDNDDEEELEQRRNEEEFRGQHEPMETTTMATSTISTFDSLSHKLERGIHEGTKKKICGIHLPAASMLTVAAADRESGATSPTGMEIPTPETVPFRKSSIVVNCASKLQPQPLLHHSPTSSTGPQPMTQ